MTTLNDIQLEINVPVTPDLAYAAISRVQDWWICDTTGETTAQGNTFLVKMGDDSFVKFEITEAQQDQRYVWHVADCYLPWFADKQEWTGTDVVFNIHPTDAGSQVTMVHKGLNESRECYEACVAGWDGYFRSSLYKLITEGLGSPK